MTKGQNVAILSMNINRGIGNMDSVKLANSWLDEYAENGEVYEGERQEFLDYLEREGIEL